MNNANSAMSSPYRDVPCGPGPPVARHGPGGQGVGRASEPPAYATILHLEASRAPAT